MEGIERYSRQIFIDEISVEGQRKILQAKVLVIGVGGLGSPVLQYLTAAGVGTLGFVDFDRVELHNLNRQILHDESSVGMEKVLSGKKRLQSLNSTIKVVGYNEKLTVENIERILDDYDIVVDCSDNFETRYLINDTCVWMNKTLVYGSIIRFDGQVSVFNYQESRNLRDIFPEAPLDAQDCEAAGVLGPLPGMIGSMMAMETLKIIVGLEALTNKLLIVNALNWQMSVIGY